MAGHLLLVVLMYSFAEMKAQALPPPALTANPAVITETETVTLNCQPPSSVSVSQCYYRIGRGKPGKVFSCLKTLTGTELLEMTHQSSPAEVKVTCFYLYGSSSPDSDVSSIIIRTSLPPKLTVNPAVIKDTDSVTLNCQPPSSVSVSQCHFYILSRGTAKVLSCLQTLTATELLEIAHQSSPAKFLVTCFYSVKIGELNYPSPHSDTSSITIHSYKPQMSLQHFDSDYVIFICSLPGPADHDTRCNLYFGEATRPIVTGRIWKTRTPTNQRFCQFTVTVDDLLRHLHLVQQSDASCDYSLGSDPNYLSPRSDRYSLTDIVEKESGVTQTVTTSLMTTGLTLPAAGTLTPADTTLMKPASGDEKTESLILVIGAVVTVGVLLPGLALLFTQSRTEKSVSKRPKTIVTGLLDGFDETYSIVTYECSSE
ncbi:uncharacterized protein LOC125892575 isoform X8 [Epinephelus fuscoguttatus]|uniref:uncharacterized protein LOC125892575 isoform X8 n=1 Tax=Epinephelus fuscoguttatus TaxID=293821 RepID=UPI0020D101C6|nr:uncharacterized protein LOC125892575 isoform X8 [Epinephelus fuscoguttatus]